MERYVVRVVLHGSKDEEDYTKLHDDMAAAGYKRQIRGDSGRLWKMPPAMYFRKINGVSSTENQREIVSTVVRKHWNREFAVLVSEAEASAWTGLEEIPEE